jgi:hypothetical protein
VTVSGSHIVSTTHIALVVFLPLALQGGLGGLVHASAGGGDVDPNALIGAVGVLNGGASGNCTKTLQLFDFFKYKS